jgi:hypothetical protein
MGKRFLVVTFIISALFIVSAGCGGDPEQQRSVVVVSSLNDNSPLLCDVMEQGDSTFDENGNPVRHDDYIAETWIPVVFYNKPYNNVVTTAPGEPHGDFLITRYTVQWIRTDGGSPALPDYTSWVGIMVPSGEYVEGMIQLVTFENKMASHIFNLCYDPDVWGCTNTGDEIFMLAHITFYGHETGTDRETEIEATLGVSFTDMVVKSED